MKILHTADWHLGKKWGKVSRLEEQHEVLDEIIQLADQHDVDAVLLAGDCFDSINPPIEAINLFYKSLKTLSKDGQRAVIVIAGNHDSPDRLQAPDPLARECGIFFSGFPLSEIPKAHLNSGLKITKSEPGYVEFELPNCSQALGVIHTPYASLQRLPLQKNDDADTHETLNKALQTHWETLTKTHQKDGKVLILMTHLFFKSGAGVEEMDDERSILHVGGLGECEPKMIPKGVDYAALGHLHRYHQVKGGVCPIVYAGSPLPYAMGDSETQKKAVLIEKNPGIPIAFTPLSLTSGKRLLRYKSADMSMSLKWLADHQDDLVELTYQSQSFMTPQERTQLLDAHPNLEIIPEVSGENFAERKEPLDLSKSMETLFATYFEHKFGQEANEGVLGVFRELR